MGKIGNMETLLRLADDWDQFPIRSLDKAEDFLTQLHAATDGWVIVDFLDASNWDCFESFSVNHDTGMLQINWHDFIEQDKQDTISQGREMMALAFPSSLYGMIMHFDCIERLGNENTCFFGLRGFALTEKQVSKALCKDTEDFVIRKDRPFALELIRKVDEHIEVIDCITSAIFTVLIVPKQMRIPAVVSETYLYHHNLAILDATLSRCEEALKTIDREDSEAICEKANTVRRTLETLLKVECCYRDVELAKPYSKARIGDLWRSLKVYHSEAIRTMMSRLAQWANELSHDTGVPVDHSKALFLATLTRVYTILLSQEINHEYRHPSFGSREDEYVAF